MSKSKGSSTFLLIKWIEHPPKWDVVHEKLVVSGTVEVRGVVGIRVGKEIGQAEILKIGTQVAFYNTRHRHSLYIFPHHGVLHF